MRPSSFIPSLPPELVGADPLSEVTTSLVEDLKKLQAMGLDLSELLKESPKKTRSEQAKVNGAKSKGPATPTGKAVSSQNALKHGIYSRAVLLPGEDVAEYDAFVADLRVELAPAGTLQGTLVQRTAEISWKLRRLPAVEGAILESARIRQERASEDEEEGSSPGGIGDLLHQLVGKTEDGILLRLQRYEVRLERSMERSLRELRLLKKDAAGSGSAVNEDARSRTAVRGRPSDRAAGSLGTGASGSFGTDAVEGNREAASVIAAASPARGPSAAPQDDVSSSGSIGQARSCAVGLGSFRTKEVVVGAGGSVLGSFRTNGDVGNVKGPISGSFGAKAGAALRMAAHAAVPASGLV